MGHTQSRDAVPRQQTLPHSDSSTQPPPASSTDNGSISRKRQRSTSNTSAAQDVNGTFTPASDTIVPRQRRKVHADDSTLPADCMDTDASDACIPEQPTASTSGARTPALPNNGTPPPHLDPLLEERNRARQRIMEALLASAAASTSLSESSPLGQMSAEPTDAASTSDVPASSAMAAAPAEAEEPVSAEALASLLGGALGAAAASSPAPTEQAQESIPGSSVQNTPTAAPAPAQVPNAPHRAPLLPLAFSGTSMIVQGALVARTRSNRRGNSDAPPTNTSARNEARSSSHPLSSSSMEPMSADATSNNDEEPRAVTLEEQAVMLSRILGIAAAATAASLVNPPGAQQVDRALLQSSLQPPIMPFGRASQQGSAELGQGRPTQDSSSSISSSSGLGIRERFAALSQRVRSASENFSRTAPRETSRITTSTEASSTTETPSPHQQEVISRLLEAANRQAELQSSTAESTSVPPRPQATTSRFGHRRSRSDASAVTTHPEHRRSLLSRFMRETLGQLVTSARPARPEAEVNSSTAATGAASNETSSRGPSDVAATLQQVRNGVLPDGVSGSFGSFLNHLLRDLMVAVQSIRPASEPLAQSDATTSDYFEQASQQEATNGAEVLDGEADSSSRSFQAQAAMLRTQVPGAEPDAAATGSETGIDAETRERRERDLRGGNLSFFRLFRFEPVAPSVLVPCIVVGVRSLDVTEQLGAELAGAQTAADAAASAAAPQSSGLASGAGVSSAPTGTSADGQTSSADELPASRFVLFVSGGRYPADHPLLNSHPSNAGQSLMNLLDQLGFMQSKSNTVTQKELEASSLRKVKGSQLPGLVAEGKIIENMAERCLVCLEDYESEDDCRLMACRHIFHAACVDRWLTSSSNTCPTCRRQGVTKDGKMAGAETADSRAAPPA